MSIIKDHSIRKTLEDGNLRNDPEVLELICDVLDSLDDDIEKLGGMQVSRKTDEKLEMLATAIDRAENAYDDEDEDEEDEDEIEYDEDEDEDDDDDDEVFDQDDEVGS